MVLFCLINFLSRNKVNYLYFIMSVREKKCYFNSVKKMKEIYK